MSFEQIESACVCMPVEQSDGSIRAGKRQKGIAVESIEQAKEIAENWREYYGI